MIFTKLWDLNITETNILGDQVYPDNSEYLGSAFGQDDSSKFELSCAISNKINLF